MHNLTCSREDVAVKAPSACGGVLYFYVLIAPLSYILLPMYLPRRFNLREATCATLGGGVFFEGLAFVVFYLLLRRSGSSLSDLGWSKTSPPKAIRNGLLTAVGMACLLFAVKPTLWVYGAEMSRFKVYGAGATLMTAVIEEVLFRGFLMTQLTRIQVPDRQQIWISGLAYGLFRAPAFWWGFPLCVAISMYWARLYKKGQHSLTPCIYSHLLFNIITEPWVTLNLVHQVVRFY